MDDFSIHSKAKHHLIQLEMQLLSALGLLSTERWVFLSVAWMLKYLCRCVFLYACGAGLERKGSRARGHAADQHVGVNMSD